MNTRILAVLLCAFVGVGFGLAPAWAAAEHESSDAVVQGGHADEHGDGHGDQEKPVLLRFDPGVALWSIIIFVLLLILLRAVAWKPILQGLQQREDFIRDSLNQAKKDREAAEDNLKEYAAKLEQARDDADAVIEQSRRDAEIARLKTKEEAQNEAEALLERAKREIDLARGTAIKEIYEVGAKLATSAAGKILGREVDAAEHERLIAESIEELARRRN